VTVDDGDDDDDDDDLIVIEASVRMKWAGKRNVFRIIV
jgi:hypothetical protein